MEQLKRNHSSIDKNWLMEIFSELKNLADSGQTAIVIFDWLAKSFFAKIEDQAIDAKLLSEVWGGDSKGSYRLQDKLYFARGWMRCFQEESFNIAKDKNDHHWFIHKIQFPEEQFKEEFIESLKLSLPALKEQIRHEVFKDKYPDYLHKSVADFFFK